MSPHDFAQVENGQKSTQLEERTQPWVAHPDVNVRFMDFGPGERQDENFRLDWRQAGPGPVTADLVEAANGAHSIALATARGHSRGVFEDALRESIFERKWGLDPDSVAHHSGEFINRALIKNPRLEKPRNWSRDVLVDYYLKQCIWYPVSNPEVAAELRANAPEGAKVSSIEDFKVLAVRECLVRFRKLAAAIMDGEPRFTVGFSDDTRANVDAIINRALFGADLTGVTAYVYDTSGGKKRRVHVAGQ